MTFPLIVWEGTQDYLEQYTKAKEKFKGIKVEDIDGLKIWKDNKTWILFRLSSNAPEFMYY